jgi:hypothetical protein
VIFGAIEEALDAVAQGVNGFVDPRQHEKRSLNDGEFEA